MTSRFRKWIKSILPRFVNCLAHALLAASLIITVYLLIIFVTGQASSLNVKLSTELNIFGSQSVSNVETAVIMGVMHNFYGGVVPLIVITTTILAGIFIYVALSILAIIGRWFMKFIIGMFNVDNTRNRLFVCFISWTILILVEWMVLNVDSTFNFLLISCILMVINLLMLTLNSWVDNRTGHDESTNIVIKS